MPYGFFVGRELPAYQVEKRIQMRVEFDPADLKCRSGSHVVVFVAYKEAFGDVDRPFTCGLLQHADTGFPAVAGHGESLDGSLRVMRTIIEGIDVCAFSGQGILHMRVK